MGIFHTTTCSSHQHSGEKGWYSLIVVGVSRCFVKALVFYNHQRVLVVAKLTNHLFSVFIVHRHYSLDS